MPDIRRASRYLDEASPYLAKPFTPRTPTFLIYGRLRRTLLYCFAARARLSRVDAFAIYCSPLFARRCIDGSLAAAWRCGIITSRHMTLCAPMPCCPRYDWLAQRAMRGWLLDGLRGRGPMRTYACFDVAAATARQLRHATRDFRTQHDGSSPCSAIEEADAHALRQITKMARTKLLRESFI